jgi:hypothetical protein
MQNTQQMAQQGDPVAFPFGVDFQKSLLRLLTEDPGFANALIPYLHPSYFESEVLSWAYDYLVKYRERYQAVPSLRLIWEEVRHLDSNAHEMYRIVIQETMHADLSTEEWLRDSVLDFAKRNVFVRAHRESRELFNQGKVTESYDFMMKKMEELNSIRWEVADRGFFFEELSQRYSNRLSVDPMADSIPTGIHGLDHVLSGGLSKGELGIWVAYAKRMKTTMLINHGVQAVRRGLHPTLHFVLEGSRALIENRYDTIFSQQEYYKVKTSDFSNETYQRMQYEYSMYKSRLVIRGFTDRFAYTAQDVLDEMLELKRVHGWVPDLIIIDYGDLLRGRGSTHRTETDHQRAAFRDIKSLTNMHGGYAIWTAAQAQRPKHDIDVKPEILQTKNIADTIEKVRVADFLGTINFTREEKMAKQARLFAEMYRDNDASKMILVHMDLNKMTVAPFSGATGAVLPTASDPNTALGYIQKSPTQGKAPL